MAKTNVQIYKRLLAYSVPYKWRIIIAMIASLGVSGSNVAIAKLVQPLVDLVLTEQTMVLVNLSAVIVISVSTIMGVSRYVQEYFMKTAGQLVVQDLRNDLFRHSIDLSLGFYAKTQSGIVVSRILNDISQLRRSAADELVNVLREGLTLIGMVFLIFYNDWRLALIAFVVLPVVVWPAANIGKRIKKYVRKSLTNIGLLTSILQESFSGIKVVKAFGTEETEKGKFNQENHNYYQRVRKVIRYDAASSPLVETISSLGAAGVLWYGLQRVMNGQMSEGELMSFFAAMAMMYSPLKRLSKSYNTIQKSVGAAERIFQLLDNPIDVQDVPNAIDLPKVRGHVHFDQVDFGYGDELVVKNFNLDVPPGQMVALVGASGAGKSTLMGLLARFYDPVRGRVTIDGYDISQVTQYSLKQQLALVDQETFLFHDTVLNNIRYSRPEAGLEKVRVAARQAFADDFILEMEQGYETVIGDRGVRLSGGQRQRICIARAILRDAPILLLDEATSALDTESEAVVQRALANLMQDRTTLVIAHRLSTVMHADRIVVLEGGELKEEGTHQQLLQRDGIYKRLFDAQFEEQE